MNTTTRSNDSAMPGPSGTAPFSTAAQAQTWRDALPAGNAQATADQLVQMLTQLNGGQLTPAQRFDIFEVLRPLSADLTDALRKGYLHASLPLAEKPMRSATLVQHILSQTALGYKLVAAGLANTHPAPEHARDLVLTSLYQAIHHLGRLLVEAYSMYAPEPKRIWEDVHRLYYFAEQRGLQSFPLKVADASTPNPSIGQAYRRIVLLALANPYHLMQGEALAVYQDLDKWAATCKITPLSGPSAHRGQLYVDLASDTPPKYAPPKLDIPPPKEGRLLDIVAIRSIAQKRIQEISAAAKTSPTGHSTLTDRKQIYMYKRLTEAWGVRSERLSARLRRELPMELMAGISACHHFLSDGQRFEPEEDEVKIQRSLPGRGGIELSLMPSEHKPWVHEDEASRLATGIVKPRTSQFSSAQDRDDKDVWVKVYSSAVQQGDDAGTEPAFHVAVCQLRDESKGGMAMCCQKGHGIQVRVGEVLGYKNGQAPSQGWAIGAVRWAKTTADNSLELGVRSLADDAAAVAVKGLKGVGKGTEYFRALLVPNLDLRHFPTTLIVPAAIFDVDSVVMINTGKDLVHARLTKLVEATNSYARFQFACVAPEDADRPAPDPHKTGRMLR